MWLTEIYTIIFLICQGVALTRSAPDNWIYDEEECPQPGSLFLPTVDIKWGAPYRALRTAPPGIRIVKSLIPDAGLGVISDRFIHKYTWLAEYDGEIVMDKAEISDHAWQVFRNDERVYLIDAYDVTTSNWLRYINCARRRSEENVVMYECMGKVYYHANKDVYPGQELLSFCGRKYASVLGIEWEEYLNS